MSSSIHYTRKAITSNIFIREKILKKKKRIFWRKTYFKVTSSSSRVSITGFFCWKIKYLVFFRRLMRLNLRELVLKYKGRPIEWGLGAWAEVERTVWMPLIQRPICNKIQKKREILRKDDLSPWFFIWTVLNLRSLKGDCVLGRGR